MARVEMTPRAIHESMRAVEKIQGINITSMDGVAGMFGGAAGVSTGNGATSTGGGNDPISQILSGLLSYQMAGPVMKKVIESVNGDVDIAANVPGKVAAPKPSAPAPGK